MNIIEIIQQSEKSLNLANNYDTPTTIILNTDSTINMNPIQYSTVYDIQHKISDYGYIELFNIIVHIMLYMKSSVDIIVLYTNQEKSFLASTQAYIEGILSRHGFEGELVCYYREE